MTLYKFCGDKSGLVFKHFEVEGRETRFSVVQTALKLKMPTFRVL